MPRKPHVYQWDDEPVDERPSEFASSTLAPRSGYHAATQPVRSRGAFGLRSVFVAALILLGAGAWVLHRLAHLLGR